MLTPPSANLDEIRLYFATMRQHGSVSVHEYYSPFECVVCVIMLIYGIAELMNLIVDDR